MSAATQMTPQRETGRKKRWFGRRLRGGMAYGALILVCIAILIPIVWVVLASLKTRREVFLEPLGLPAVPQWQNYTQILETAFPANIANSVIITVGSVVPMVIFSLMAGYVLARRVFLGRRLVYVVIVLTFAIPFHSILVPLYRMVDALGLLNTFAGLILPNIAIGIPFSVMIFYSFFRDFPAELEEAARLDGCSPWRILFSVVLPLSAPVVLSVVILQTVNVWNEFLWASISTTGDEVRPWTTGIMQFQGEYSSDWPRILAVVNVVMVPLILLYLVSQKYFVRAFAGMNK
ncbi:carbohydrate ABC transporter permease [Oceaniglobus trochenteri]|uniref:carbohydrate ABC transporter permease n=1 Tax=Oceaniglobus trochenteri TaxID=2763260 RepID=UPI001CFF8F10|nr:carbohydrate ABC transporter permease [Oceaniglobus trochenteri]